jgi:hypothetical protein
MTAILDTREYVIQSSDNNGETWRHCPGHSYVSPLQATSAATTLASDKRNSQQTFRVIEVRQTWTVVADIIKTTESFEPACFADFKVGDRIKFVSANNGFGQSGDDVIRTGTVIRATEKTLTVDCDPNWYGKRAVIRRAEWNARCPLRAPGGPSDTCSVCGKEECANEVCGTEFPATAAPVACPTHRVKLNPGAASPECPIVYGIAEYGVFGDEGSLEAHDCAYSAANSAAEYAAEDPDTQYTVRRLCNDHRDNAADTCEDCN